MNDTKLGINFLKWKFIFTSSITPYDFNFLIQLSFNFGLLSFKSIHNLIFATKQVNITIPRAVIYKSNKILITPLDSIDFISHISVCIKSKGSESLLPTKWKGGLENLNSTDTWHFSLGQSNFDNSPIFINFFIYL